MTTTTTNKCCAIHTQIGEMFVISLQPSYEHKEMFDLTIEGEGKNKVFITATKEELSKIGFSILRCSANIN
jgi:hypothetical protein